jgi:S-formylglutathione hydrolase
MAPAAGWELLSNTPASAACSASTAMRRRDRPADALCAVPAAAGAARAQAVPLLVCLAGLTCTEETFTMKAGAQRVAAELGLALLMPDTSPRGANVPGESDSWDFGVGAGFYLDATQAPWATHWRMESWLLAELLPQVWQQSPVLQPRTGIFGHSMGGHGALTLALRHPGVFASVSAWRRSVRRRSAPGARRPSRGYLGADRSAWAAHDASALMRRRAPRRIRRASWSTRAWPTSSWPSSCIPKRSRPPAPPWASR